MNPPLLVFLVFSHLTFAQNATVLDSTFSKQNVFDFDIFYYHDTQNTEGILSVQDKKFAPFEENFPGLKNSKFWFQVNIENNLSIENKVILNIKSPTITHFTIYKKEESSFLKVHEFKDSSKKCVSIPLTMETEENSYFIEVFFKRSVFFPIEILSEKESASIKQRNLISDALFYGFTLVIIIINLLFYINTKNRFFIYYCFLLLAITMSFMNSQGLFYNVIDKYGGNTKINVVLVLNAFIMISFRLFTANSLQLDKHYPKHKYLYRLIFACFLFFAVTYLVSSNVFWYSLAKIAYFLITIIYWFFGILLFKRLIYARFLTIGYSILFVMQILYMLSLNFGFTQLYFSGNYYKLGCVAEMLVFLYAISYRHKEVEKKKNVLESSYVESLKNIENLEKELTQEKKKKRVRVS